MEGRFEPVQPRPGRWFEPGVVVPEAMARKALFAEAPAPFDEVEVVDNGILITSPGPLPGATEPAHVPGC